MLLGRLVLADLVQEIAVVDDIVPGVVIKIQFIQERPAKAGFIARV